MVRINKKDSIAQNRFYMNLLSEIGRNPDKLLKSSKVVSNIPRTNQSIGKMFMYAYDAKTKDQLKWWDRLPLIVYLKTYQDGFLGLNLHYFPISIRLQLFETILPKRDLNDYKVPGQAKLNLKGLRDFPGVEFGLKRYLTSHIRSRILAIHPLDWADGVYLPLAQFTKASKQKVWGAYRSRYWGK